MDGLLSELDDCGGVGMSGTTFVVVNFAFFCFRPKSLKMDGRPLFAAVVDVIFADFPDVSIVEACDFELTCEERLTLSGTSITAEVSTSGTTIFIGDGVDTDSGMSAKHCGSSELSSLQKHGCITAADSISNVES